MGVWGSRAGIASCVLSAEGMNQGVFVVFRLSGMTVVSGMARRGFGLGPNGEGTDNAAIEDEHHHEDCHRHLLLHRHSHVRVYVCGIEILKY